MASNPLSPQMASSAPPTTVAVPAGAPSWVTPALIAQTSEVWQPYYPDPLTTEDALSIIQSVCRLFDVLKENKESPP